MRRVGALQLAGLLLAGLVLTVLVIVLRDAVKRERRCHLDRTIVTCQRDADR
jgi:hypothetical protein